MHVFGVETKNRTHYAGVWIQPPCILHSGIIFIHVIVYDELLASRPQRILSNDCMTYSSRFKFTSMTCTVVNTFSRRIMRVKRKRRRDFTFLCYPTFNTAYNYILGARCCKLLCKVLFHPFCNPLLDYQRGRRFYRDPFC